ncbi:MAG: hypothetical protein LBD04_06770, partial [Synergistaceae bacterium]|nr:hypothetical protein [Synergistaceae bacterium]
RAPNITHLFGPSGYKAIFINAVFQSKLYQDSMVMIDTLSGWRNGRVRVVGSSMFKVFTVYIRLLVSYSCA